MIEAPGLQAEWEQIAESFTVGQSIGFTELFHRFSFTKGRLNRILLSAIRVGYISRSYSDNSKLLAVYTRLK